MGNQFIRMIDGRQVLVSYYGSNHREYIHGWVVYSEGDRYLVLLRDTATPSNAIFAGFIAPIGSCARDMSKVATDDMVKAYDRQCEVAA